MDHVDVEAAAVPASAARDLAIAEDSGAQGHHAGYSLVPTPTNDGKQHESMKRIAHAVTDRLLRCLTALVQEEFHNAETPLELLVPASSETDALAGALENITESQAKPDVGHDGQGREEDLGNKPFHKQMSSISLHDTASVQHIEDENNRNQKKDENSAPQDPTQSRKTSSDYTQRVEKMTQEEINAENKSRRSYREKWRAGEDLSYLEDPWKHLWRRNDTDAELLFRRCTDAERRGLQLDLIDALYFIPKAFNLEIFPWRGLRGLSSWVSLIGLRLSRICGPALYKYNDGSSGIGSCPASRHIQVLIECLWVCTASPSSTVGDVMKACYRRGILRQPDFDDESHDSQPSVSLRTYLRMVHIAIFLVNILYKHQLPGLVVEDLEVAWSKRISEAEMTMRHVPRMVPFNAGNEPFLTVSDLNLEDLQEIGRLEVRWTPYWDEHLELETTRPTSVLKLYWFSPRTSEFFSKTGLCGGLEEDDRAQRMEEIYVTLNLLLTSKSKPKDFRRRYGQLVAPSWLALLAHERLQTWNPERQLDTTSGDFPNMSSLWQDDPEMTRFCHEMEDHLRLPWPNSRQLRRVTYAEYPIYYERLRNLRCYMDAQQPDGWRALWRDKRNPNAYYTFWIAISFGLLSILLAFLALAAAVVQAYSQVTSSE